MKYNKGDKFVIEIEKKIEEAGIYKIKGFKSLVFDDYGLDKLKQLNIPDASASLDEFNNGREDAWMMAQKIYKPTNEGGLRGSDVKKYFGCSVDDIYKLSIQEVAKAFKHYEEDHNLDWSKVPKDTPVLVRKKGGMWKRRYFSQYKDGLYYVYDNGATSWSGFCEIPYEEAKLAEE